MTPFQPWKTDELRQRAKARLIENEATSRSTGGQARTEYDTQRLVQELQIHQIELEMQNEQLEQARVDTLTALELYTDLYEFAPAGYFTLDRDGMIRQANLTSSKLLGVERSRLVNRRFEHFVANHSRSAFRAFVTKIFSGQSLEFCEAMLLREESTPFYARIEAENSGNGQGCRAVVVDITERKRAEEKIQEQANLLELAHDAIMVRGLDEKIQYWNKGAEKLYGWTTREAIGGHFVEMVHANPAGFKAAREVLLTKGSWEGEFRKVTKTGQEVMVASRWTLLRDSQGVPVSVLAIDTDITEKRQMEAQLRTQRLEIIGTLAGGIAHDLNNILQVIITNLDLMATLTFNKQGRKYLGDATEGAKRATGLARRLLTFSKGGAPVKQSLDMEEIVTQAVRLALSGSKLQPRFAFQHNLYPVFGDPVQLTQVIENVVINSREATPAGGKLLVHAENIDERTRASLVLRPGRYVRIQIEDGGSGIPQSIIDKIFDICFSTKPDGTGLGLATVKSIMAQHDGSITIDSLVGSGTTVSLLLPASSHSFELPPPPVPSTPVTNMTGRILIIDDEEMILSVVSSMLKTLGCQCAVARDGMDGLEEYRRAKAAGNPFAAVLLDGTIPNGVAGEEALRLLREADPGARVILCSGYADSDLFKNAEQLGFRAVLSKPFSIPEFISVLNKSLSS